MKDVRFYLEYPNKKEKNKATRKKLGNHSGSVLAVFYENHYFDGYTLCFDAIGGLTCNDNPHVCSTGAGQDYLSDRCKRISEETARQIHPNLFQRLDDDGSK